jgi:hypothetical protein
MLRRKHCTGPGNRPSLNGAAHAGGLDRRLPAFADYFRPSLLGRIGCVPKILRAATTVPKVDVSAKRETSGEHKLLARPSNASPSFSSASALRIANGLFWPQREVRPLMS